MAWKAAGKHSMAFVIFNRFLDMADAQDDPGVHSLAELENADFVNTGWLWKQCCLLASRAMASSPWTLAAWGTTWQPTGNLFASVLHGQHPSSQHKPQVIACNGPHSYSLCVADIPYDVPLPQQPYTTEEAREEVSCPPPAGCRPQAPCCRTYYACTRGRSSIEFPGLCVACFLYVLLLWLYAISKTMLQQCSTRCCQHQWYQHRW